MAGDKDLRDLAVRPASLENVNQLLRILIRSREWCGVCKCLYTIRHVLSTYFLSKNYLCFLTDATFPLTFIHLHSYHLPPLCLHPEFLSQISPGLEAFLWFCLKITLVAKASIRQAIVFQMKKQTKDLPVKKDLV